MQSQCVKLCSDGDYKGYTLGEEVYTNIFNEGERENLLVKKDATEDEYELSKQIYNVGIYSGEHFTPEIFDFFYCTTFVRKPDFAKLNLKQSRKKMQWEREHPDIKGEQLYNYVAEMGLEELGEVKYIEKNINTGYLIMEKIIGTSLETLLKNKNKEDTILLLKKYFDTIYNYYTILCSQGYKLNDLFARNIIVAESDKIKFIDFGPDLIEVYCSGRMMTYEEYDKTGNIDPIPETQRMNKLQLLQNLMQDVIPGYKKITKPDHPYHSILSELNVTATGGKKRNTRKKNTRKRKNTKKIKKRTKRKNLKTR